MHTFHSWLENATQPTYPYYHHVQVALFGGFSYLTSALLTRTPPLNSMAITISAYTISQFTAPLFVKLLQPYKDYSLVPLTGQVVHISFCFATANLVCSIFGLSISYKLLPKEIAAFLSVIAVTRLVLQKTR